MTEVRQPTRVRFRISVAVWRQPSSTYGTERCNSTGRRGAGQAEGAGAEVGGFRPALGIRGDRQSRLGG